MPTTGTPREWLRPLNHLGSDVLGSHRGQHEALNIRNAQPGFHYYWARRKASDVQRFLNAGWLVVGADPNDKEQYGADLLPRIQEGLDGTKPYQDVILLKIPVSKYKQILAQREADNKAAIGASSAAFEERGRELAISLGTSDGRPIYAKNIRRTGHGTQFSDRDDE